jgi:hypothetical protein
MPGGENAIIVPDGPDRTAKIEVVISVLKDWGVGPEDREDCAREIIEELARPVDSGDLPPFIERRVRLAQKANDP